LSRTAISESARRHPANTVKLCQQKILLRDEIIKLIERTNSSRRLASAAPNFESHPVIRTAFPAVVTFSDRQT
jgi:hypothetical protein